MQDEQNLTAEDLSHIKSEDGGDKGKPADAGGDKGKSVEDEGKSEKAAAKTEPKGETKTIATGADAETEDKAKEEAAEKAVKPYWPENWREKLAEHISAGDQKAYKRELKRLERITDPSGVYGNFRELEAKFTSGGLVKVPGKDAKPEDIAEFHKALGVPEKPEEYFKHVKLENGAVIGEADKPLVDAFAAEMHKVGAPPAVMNAALNWHYKQQEDAAAQLDESDDSFRRESEKALKDDLGSAFKRKTNAIGSLFATAPGGTDVKNEGSLYARLMGGRMADGKIIGNDPDMVRFLVGLVSEVNPAATVVEDGNQSGLTVDAEIAAIEKRMKDDRRAYFKDEKAQARYRELIDARSKIQARNKA